MATEFDNFTQSMARQDERARRAQTFATSSVGLGFTSDQVWKNGANLMQRAVAGRNGLDAPLLDTKEAYAIAGDSHWMQAATLEKAAIWSAQNAHRAAAEGKEYDGRLTPEQTQQLLAESERGLRKEVRKEMKEQKGPKLGRLGALLGLGAGIAQHGPKPKTGLVVGALFVAAAIFLTGGLALGPLALIGLLGFGIGSVLRPLTYGAIGGGIGGIIGRMSRDKDAVNRQMDEKFVVMEDKIQAAAMAGYASAQKRGLVPQAATPASADTVAAGSPAPAAAINDPELSTAVNKAIKSLRSSPDTEVQATVDYLEELIRKNKGDMAAVREAIRDLPKAEESSLTEALLRNIEEGNMQGIADEVQKNTTTMVSAKLGARVASLNKRIKVSNQGGAVRAMLNYFTTHGHHDMDVLTAVRRVRNVMNSKLSPAERIAEAITLFDSQPKLRAAMKQAAIGSASIRPVIKIMEEAGLSFETARAAQAAEKAPVQQQPQQRQPERAISGTDASNVTRLADVSVRHAMHDVSAKAPAAVSYEHISSLVAAGLMPGTGAHAGEIEAQDVPQKPKAIQEPNR